MSDPDYDSWIMCDQCYGTGRYDNDNPLEGEWHRCEYCNGNGGYYYTDQFDDELQEEDQ